MNFLEDFKPRSESSPESYKEPLRHLSGVSFQNVANYKKMTSSAVWGRDGLVQGRVECCPVNR